MSGTDEPTTSNENPAPTGPPDRVMILFMGGRHEHAITSIQRYAPDAVHIVTSDDFREQYVRRLNDWSKKYEFRKGTVQSVNDLFESTSVDSLFAKAFEIIPHENEQTGNISPSRWYVGLTGGTMHMAAVATMLTNLLNATAFYVIRPSDGSAVMPNRHVLEFPSLTAMSLATGIHKSDVEYLMGESKGKMSDLAQNSNLPEALFYKMVNQNLLRVDGSGEQWALTPVGHRCFSTIMSGAMYMHLKIIEEMKIKEEEANAEAANEEQNQIYFG